MIISVKRVLKPHGLAKIQLRTGLEAYRWRWFYGVSMSLNETKKMVEQHGFIVLNIETENAKSLWLVIQKPE